MCVLGAPVEGALHPETRVVGDKSSNVDLDCWGCENAGPVAQNFGELMLESTYLSQFEEIIVARSSEERMTPSEWRDLATIEVIRTQLERRSCTASSAERG